MIERIQHLGRLLYEGAEPGETRADRVFAANPNGIRVARDRFLLLYCTRGYRGTDDDLSVCYQLRADDWTGRLLAQGTLSKSINDWNPLGDGVPAVRQHGHVVGFGVPKGALIHGQRVPHENIFAIKWRLCARYLDPHTGLMTIPAGHFGVHGDPTQDVEWLQLRLNDTADNIDIIARRRPLRMKGFENTDRLCDADVTRMNQCFVNAVPYNEDCTEWADVNHFDGGRIAAMRYRFNAETGFYEWVQIGPRIGSPENRVGEASLVRFGSDWLIAARSEPTAVWARTNDLFGAEPQTHRPSQPHICAPLSVYRGADQRVYLFTGDPDVSPHRNCRDPLYMWNVDVDAGFKVDAPRVIFDSIAADIGIPQAQVPRVAFAKLLEHAGGTSQMLLHQVRSKATLDPKKTGTIISEAEMDAAGIYHAHIIYHEPMPPAWTFD